MFYEEHYLCWGAESKFISSMEKEANEIPILSNVTRLLSEGCWLYRCGAVSQKLHRHDIDEVASRKEMTTNTRGASADGIITD